MHVNDPPEDLFRVRRAAARYYRPEVYRGRVLLFKGASEFISGRYREASYGWAALVRGGLEMSIVESDHLDMFDEHNIEQIALTLRSRLFEIQNENGKIPYSSAQSLFFN